MRKTSLAALMLLGWTAGCGRLDEVGRAPGFTPFEGSPQHGSIYAAPAASPGTAPSASLWSSGREALQQVATNETFFVADPWQPTLLREGAGLNARFVNNRWVTLNLRAGLGLRQNRYGGAWVIEDAHVGRQ